MKFICLASMHAVRRSGSTSASFAGLRAKKLACIPDHASAPIRRGFAADGAAGGASKNGDQPAAFQIMTQDDFALAKQVAIVAVVGGGIGATVVGNIIKLLVDDSINKNAAHTKDIIDYVDQTVEHRIKETFKGTTKEARN